MTHPDSAPDSLFITFQSAVAGRYSLDRELGRGGMGVVYLAREVQLDRLVAIKLLPPELSHPSSRERFMREAQTAAKLSHPNIIPIHAVEATDDFVYYVMAFVNGETLAERVDTRGPLSATDGIRLLREISWALGHAHGQGVVHRDIKPDNILIEATTGRALVADFGIAALAGETRGDRTSGTPEFMSPEQALGQSVDARSDLYSLGATAFYLLSGRLPFAGATATETIAQHITTSAPTVTSTGVHVPRKLALLVDRCLAKDPSNRPSSANALADELGVAIEQRRELPAALRAFVKRNGRMDGAGTVFGLIGAFAASVATAALAGGVAGTVVFGASLIAMPVAFGISAAKRLLDLGFAQADIVPAFRAEQESSREERSVHFPKRFSWRSFAEGALRRVAGVGGATAALLVPFALTGIGTARFMSVGTIALAMATAGALAAFGYLMLLQLRRDVDVEFWTSVWTGRFGTTLFAIARRVRGSRPMVRAMTHRATELSLGLAAEQLFESLPKSSRETLDALPAVIQRLQSDAAALRERCNQLQDALAHRVTGSAPDTYAAIGEEHQLVQQRLQETVGTLERIRLGLLRLHAGSITAEGLTTHVAIASEMTTHLDRMIAANAEVEEALCFPNLIALTPA